ncbi:LysR family transcriptional regulator [Paenibacillus sp. P26]|nr:LysR family transcriptional regulator [Paenibacillus sp. P26]
MNFEILQHFTETVRLKSIAKASERLNLTPPALGKRLRRLEAYYGVTLLRRTPAGVEPTEAGVLLLEQIGPPLQEHERLRAELAGYRGRGRCESVRSRAWPRITCRPRRLRWSRPESRRRSRSGLLPTSCTPCWTTGNWTPASASPRKGTLFGINRCLPSLSMPCLPRNHRLAAADTVPLDELAGESFVMYPAACRIRQCVTGAFRAEGMEPKVKSEVPFGDYLLGYVAAGEAPRSCRRAWPGRCRIRCFRRFASTIRAPAGRSPCWPRSRKPANGRGPFSADTYAYRGGISALRLPAFARKRGSSLFR